MTGDVFKTLGDIVSTVELAVADVLGVRMTLRHRDGTELPVIARITGRQIQDDSDGFHTIRDTVTIEIAVGQGNFTLQDGIKKPIGAGDLLVYGKSEFHVIPPITENEYGTVYTLVCEEHQALQSGSVK